MSLLPKAISYFPYYEYIAVGNGLTNEIPPPPPPPPPPPHLSKMVLTIHG